MRSRVARVMTATPFPVRSGWVCRAADATPRCTTHPVRKGGPESIVREGDVGAAGVAHTPATSKITKEMADQKMCMWCVTAIRFGMASGRGGEPTPRASSPHVCQFRLFVWVCPHPPPSTGRAPGDEETRRLTADEVSPTCRWSDVRRWPVVPTKRGVRTTTPLRRSPDGMLCSMSEIEHLQLCGQGPVGDAAATAGVRVAVSEWIDPKAGIGAVVHAVGLKPHSPMWDAHGLLGEGDAIALHPAARPAKQFPEKGSDTEVTIAIADAVQMLVQVLLWQRGLDPTWPACPEHRGRHPLVARHATPRRRHELESAGLLDASARWECPEGDTSIEIGTLGKHPD